MNFFASISTAFAVVGRVFTWRTARKKEEKTDDLLDTLGRSDSAVSGAEQFLRRDSNGEDN